jgi:5'-methylthioadenosine phosphorylase
MSRHRIGIIGGSGLYHLEGFTHQKWVKVWVKVKTPFGPSLDDFLTGTLGGREVTGAALSTCGGRKTKFL